MCETKGTSNTTIKCIKDYAEYPCDRNFKLLSITDLKNPTNYFEWLEGDKPTRPFIDLDGKMPNEDSEVDFYELNKSIMKKLITIENVSIIMASHFRTKKYDSVTIPFFDTKTNKTKKKLARAKDGTILKELKETYPKISFRITWYNEYCSNIDMCKIAVVNEKKQILIDLLGKEYFDKNSEEALYLDVDDSVFRTAGKMRCVNAYKDAGQPERINELIKGTIEQTFIQGLSGYETLFVSKHTIPVIKNNPNTKVKQSKSLSISPNKEKNKKVVKQDNNITNKQDINMQNQNYSKTDPIVILLFEYLGNDNISFQDYTTIGLTLKNNDYPLKLFYDWAQLSTEYATENQTNTPIQWEDYHSRYYPIENIYKIIKNNKPNKWSEYKKRFLDSKYFISLEDFNKGETQIIKILLPIIKNEVVYSQKRFYILNKTTQLWEKVDNIMYYISNLIHKFLDHSVYKIAEKVNIEDDKEKKDELRKQIREYKKAYKTSSSQGFLSCIQKHCKVALIDNSFYDNLDSTIDIICFKNGLYDLKNNEFRPIYDKDYVSKTLDYDYKPSNEQDKKYVRDILYKICNANKEHLEYYLSILGHSLTGRSKVKALYFFFGEKGNNGKTTFLDILTSIFPIYVGKSNRDLVLNKSNDKHKFIADLHGKRVVWIDELTTSKLDTSFLKEYADGRSMQYKVMYGETATLQVRSKLFMITNHTPKYDNDGGMEKRIKLLKFNSEFSEDTEEDDYENLNFIGDSELSKKIINDYKYALIELLFESSSLYYTEGIKPYPQDFQDEKNILTEGNDKFNSWFNEYFEVSTDYKYSKKEMENCLLYFKRQNISFTEVKDGLTRLGYKYDSQMSFGCVNGKKIRGGWNGFRLISLDNNINNGECNVNV
jgi:P4 family phage/plasmid primase-like protien